LVGSILKPEETGETRLRRVEDTRESIRTHIDVGVRNPQGNQNMEVKETASENSLLAEYDGAWKQIEHYMNANWQFIGMLLSLAVVATFCGEYFGRHWLLEAYDWFFLLTVTVFILLGIVYSFFFKRNTALAHIHSIRILEIEAYLGMRSNWRAYLGGRELEHDFDKWADKGTKEFTLADKDKARDIIETNKKCESSNGLLNRIIHKKRQEAYCTWPLTWKRMSGLGLVYAGGIVLVGWVLGIIALLVLFKMLL
jgi:hypothetical protein